MALFFLCFLVLLFGLNALLIKKYEPRQISDPGFVSLFVDGCQNGDLIGVSCGPQINGPLDFIFTQPATSPETRINDLVDLRCAYKFSSVRNGTVITSHVEVPMVDVPETPKQLRLSFSLTDDEQAVVVRWTSACSKHPSFVEYGPVSNRLDGTKYQQQLSCKRVMGRSWTFDASVMCERPANETSQAKFRDPGWQWEAVLPSLETGQRYWYRVSNCNMTSSVRSFKMTPPRPTAASASAVRFIAFGDMGSWRGDQDPRGTAARIQNEIEANDVGLVVLAGDISYAESRGYLWDYYFSMIEGAASRAPWHYAWGNHEWDSTDLGWHPEFNGVCGSSSPFGGNSNGECGQAVMQRSPVPRGPYSLQYGNVRLVFMNSEENWLAGSPQYRWLDQELQRVRARQPADHVVIVSHRQMYTSQYTEMPGQPNDLVDRCVGQQMQHALEPLFVRYGVKLMISGHQHTAERSCRAVAGKCRNDGSGIVHYVVGTGGAGCGPPCPPFLPQNTTVRQFQANIFGYLRITSFHDRLLLQLIDNTDAAVIDQVEII